MTKRKQSLCQNKTGFDYQLNTLRISYFSKKKIHIFIVEYFYTFPQQTRHVHHLVSGTINNRKDNFITFFLI